MGLILFSERDKQLYLIDIFDSCSAINEFIVDFLLKRFAVIGVGLEIVWKIIQDDLPVSMNAVKGMIGDTEGIL
jgi:uncharacterized protein with HEPN domain